MHFTRPHPEARISFRREPGGLRPVADRRAWLAAAAGRQLFLVAPELPTLRGLPEPPPDLAARVRRTESRHFEGIFPIRVVVSAGTG